MTRSRPLRPFCRATKGDHTCHRMLGHLGPHVERHGQSGDDRPDVEWFTTVPEITVRPSLVRTERQTAPPAYDGIAETLRRALRAETEELL
jgi:hypothetical protein